MNSDEVIKLAITFLTPYPGVVKNVVRLRVRKCRPTVAMNTNKPFSTGPIFPHVFALMFSALVLSNESHVISLFSVVRASACCAQVVL